MEVNFSGELVWLLIAFILGVLAGLLYDIIRPLRNHWGRAAGVILDILFAVTSGISFFVFAMASENCRLGLWQLSASLLGFLGYLYSLSRWVSPILNSSYEYLTAFNEKIKILLKNFRISTKNLFKKM